jgi:putative acetyltransferase
MTSEIFVREEGAEDGAAVRIVNERAFGQPQEANIVDRLRQSCPDLLSLVATSGEKVVGHLLFSPATVRKDSDVVRGMGLAPMAVLPEYQRQGIGSRLVRTGLAILRERLCPFVIVLGHPHYYPRFGFQPASKYGLKCQWSDVPDEAFMVLIMDGPTMKGVSGVVSYRDEFNEAM